MYDGFDLSGLQDYERDIIHFAKENMPEETKKFLRKEARKLNTQNKKTYKSCGIGWETGNLEAGFKVGKIYSRNSKTNYCIRAYNNSPHAHLQNNGWLWRPKGTKFKFIKGKRIYETDSEHFIPGFKFLEKANAQFDGTYDGDCETFVNDVLRKGL